MFKPRKMYIDVDGVLVVWDPQYNCIELARGFGRLMRFCKIHDIKPYWLSFWSHIPSTLEGLNCLLWPKSCPTMAVPEILTYERAKGKLSVVDFDSDFVWIEDGIDEKDMRAMEERGMGERFFWTDGLDKDCLIKLIEHTRRVMKLPAAEDWGPHWESGFSRARSPQQGRISPTY